MMKNWITAVVAAAGACGMAAAQDSVSSFASTGMGNDLGSASNSDAPSPFDTAQTINAYIIDMGSEPTSWGNVFGYAPLIKSHQLPGSTFYNNLTSGASISQTVLRDVPFASSTYAFWDQPGFGVHPTNNFGASQIKPAGLANQFAVASANFGTNNFNSVQTAIVNYQPLNPARLYVTRVSTVANSDVSFVGNQFGLGSVNAKGATYFRADSFGSSGPIRNSGLTAIVRVNAENRDPNSLNLFVTTPGLLDAGATTELLFSTVSTPTPGNVPSDLTIGGADVAFGVNFDGAYLNGSTFPLSVNNSRPHINNALVGGTRGNIAFSPVTISTTDGSVGTGAQLGKSFAAGDGPTDTLNLFGIDGNGNVTNTYTFSIPNTLTDFVDSFSISNGAGIEMEFDHYRGATPFRASIGQVAIGKLPNGRVVAAATVYYAGLAAIDPNNLIAVVDFDPANPAGSAQWRLAAWNGVVAGGMGKPIKDGPGGATIGNLVSLFEVTGGSPFGPSFSAPYIDGMGNIWFIGAAVQQKEDQNGMPFDDFDSILFRAVWNGADGYELERVLELGDVIEGQNSGRQYQIQFMGISGASSVSPSTLWSNSGMGRTWNDISTADLAQDDTESTGGLVLQVAITYDADDDGDFNNTTSGGYDATADMDGRRDENYQVTLYVGHGGFPRIPSGPQGCNPADLNDAVAFSPASPVFGIPDGILTPADFVAFVTFFNSNDLRADLNDATAFSPASPAFGMPDGAVTPADFVAFVAYFNAGCPCALPGCP